MQKKGEGGGGEGGRQRASSAKGSDCALFSDRTGPRSAARARRAASSSHMLVFRLRRARSSKAAPGWLAEEGWAARGSRSAARARRATPSLHVLVSRLRCARSSQAAPEWRAELARGSRMYGFGFSLFAPATSSKRNTTTWQSGQQCRRTASGAAKRGRPYLELRVSLSPSRLEYGRATTRQPAVDQVTFVCGGDRLMCHDCWAEGLLKRCFLAAAAP